MPIQPKLEAKVLTASKAIIEADVRMLRRRSELREQESSELVEAEAKLEEVSLQLEAILATGGETK